MKMLVYCWFLCCVCVLGFKPVIIIHGLFDTSADFIHLKHFINQSHPGTNVSVIDLFDRTASLQPLWKQVEGFKKAIFPIMQNAADGFHLLCYSQGGLICRGIVSTLNDHNVHSFISLSSPQAGQYGDTDYLKFLFPEFVKSNLYHLCYTAVGQRISICNYWNDPHHSDMYVNTSDFLAPLNNERPHPESQVWKQNFLRIKKLVLIGGPDDGVIMPWQSSQFGFYDDNETVVEMKSREVFLRDAFGLKSLDARGDLKLCSVAGVEHVYWHSNETSHPGTNVSVIDLFDRTASLQPLWKQVEGFKKAIFPIMQNAADGFHLLCYSQGGLICRGIVSTLNDHNVHSFISLSSPQAGQYGDTDYLKFLFPEFVKSNLYHLCYTAVGQRISICNYWNDPHHSDMYVNTSDFLAPLNNERPHPESQVWKQNFLRIKKLVLIGGPDDGVIMPWQSSQFGFYDDNETVVEMKSREVFLRDAFGLKSLDARGDLKLCSVAGVEHVYWHSNETVYKSCIEKWLT